ncbi:MAG TPA: serine--tRNA ligase [Candidatus Paceibacterota bacterium]|nr:serine--tRNA ligase [Candidatus Pacearchaeota archaeon]HRZ51156.1 serine--tRNA ligase [Candidatus Paceibacterota bacterium]HSA36837.1 serine--tRNA ligase [Candidatus Paceibacterota bacterium]
MLDIKFIRKDPDAVKAACRVKNVKCDIDKLLDLDEKKIKIQQELEAIAAEKNKASRAIPQAKDESERKGIISAMQALGDNENNLAKKHKELEQEYMELMYLVPNIPSADSPIGSSDLDNKEVSRWGEPAKFDFEPKDHIQLGKDLDIIDTETGVNTSGFRGYYLKNEAVMLHYAIFWHALNKMRQKGFDLFVPPTIVREFVLLGSGHFPSGRDEVYVIGNPGKLESGEAVKEPAYLAGTSEPSLLAYHSGEVIAEKKLPIKMCGISQCYRSEVGSYGKDAKGLYRLHEFMKVEQVVICKDDIEESNKWLEEMREISQGILKDLKLPHRVLAICTGDMGSGKYKMYDIETWMPSRQAYGETHSDSNLTDWQTRRLNMRYKDKEGKMRFPYALNNTVVASPRLLIAILENYQQKDGSVAVPEVLQPYLGGQKKIEPKK